MKPTPSNLTQNDTANEFLEEMCSEIRFRGVHKAIAEEYAQHIEEEAQNLISDGSDPDAAYTTAVANMGDPHQIGKQLDKTHRPLVDWQLILITAALVIFGLVYQHNVGGTRMISPATLGLIAFACLMFFNYQRLECRSVVLYIGSMLALYAVYRLTYTGDINSVNVYIIYSDSAPSVLMATLVIITFAGMVKRFCTGNRRDFVKLLALAILPLYLLLLMNRVIYDCIIFVAMIMMITAGILHKDFKGNRRNYLVAFYGGLTVLILFFIFDTGLLNSPRLIFFSPFSDVQLEDYLGEGYWQVRLLQLVQTAPAVGQAPLDNLNYDTVALYSEFRVNYSFTGVVATMGWAFGLLLLLLFTLFLLYIAYSLRGTRDYFGRILAVGILAYFGVQVGCGVLVGMGILPSASIYLPFISLTATPSICNMALVGLLASVYRRRNILCAEPKRRRKPLRHHIEKSKEGCEL